MAKPKAKKPSKAKQNALNVDQVIDLIPVEAKTKKQSPKMLKAMQKIAEKANNTLKEKGDNDPVIIVPGQKIANVDWIPSGVRDLDLQLSGEEGKGWPRGRIIEIYGPESAGKTTLATQALAAFQRASADDPAGFVDVEHAVDLAYMQKIGVDTNSLLFSQPRSGEQALSVAMSMIEGGCSCVVLDSVAALVPRAEIEGDIGDSHIGLQARMMGQALRKITPILRQTNATLIFTNQIRMKVGVMFGNPETQPGGNALKFYASIRLDVRVKERNKVTRGNNKEAGNVVSVKSVKNKLHTPFITEIYSLVFGSGFENR